MSDPIELIRNQQTANRVESAQRSLERRSDSRLQNFEFIGRDASTGKGIVRSGDSLASGQINTSGHLKPNQRVLVGAANAGNVSIKHKPRVRKKKSVQTSAKTVYRIKILFSKLESLGGVLMQCFYLGGDRKTPLKIFEIPYNYSTYAVLDARLANTGKGQNDWIASFVWLETGGSSAVLYLVQGYRQYFSTYPTPLVPARAAIVTASGTADLGLTAENVYLRNRGHGSLTSFNIAAPNLPEFDNNFAQLNRMISRFNWASIFNYPEAYYDPSNLESLWHQDVHYISHLVWESYPIGALTGNVHLTEPKVVDANWIWEYNTGPTPADFYGAATITGTAKSIATIQDQIYRTEGTVSGEAAWSNLTAYTGTNYEHVTLTSDTSLETIILPGETPLTRTSFSSIDIRNDIDNNNHNIQEVITWGTLLVGKNAASAIAIKIHVVAENNTYTTKTRSFYLITPELEINLGDLSSGTIPGLSPFDSNMIGSTIYKVGDNDDFDSAKNGTLDIDVFKIGEGGNITKASKKTKYFKLGSKDVSIHSWSYHP